MKITFSFNVIHENFKWSVLYLMNRVYLAQRPQFHLHSKCFSWTLGRNKMLEITLYFKEICKEHFMTFYGLAFLILFSFCLIKK